MRENKGVRELMSFSTQMFNSCQFADKCGYDDTGVSWEMIWRWRKGSLWMNFAAQGAGSYKDVSKKDKQAKRRWRVEETQECANSSSYQVQK